MIRAKLIFISIILLTFTSNLFTQSTTIEHMDPPNWWIGMEHNEVQILVYGKDIGTTKPSFKYEGIELVNIISTTNPNYIFIDISINKDAKPGNIDFSFEKNGKIVTSQSFPILKRDFSSESIQGFNNSDVMYLITPDRFVNGDPSNDEVPTMIEKTDRNLKGGRHGGDILGLQNSLDYIKDLGFTSIWLNPVLENNMETYSYHGYSTTDYYKVDPRYGSNLEYQKFCIEAHNKGIKIIMDMIANHCGLNHWWMKDLPSKDWINFEGNFVQTNHRKTVWQDPYVSKVDKKLMSDGWFVPSMPDLNQRNELMSRYLIQNSIWWIEFVGLSGIRQDTYPYPDEDFMSDWTKAIMDEYPNFSIVGEEWNESPNIVAYWQAGKENANGYVSHLTHVMDFPVQSAMSKSLNESEGGHQGGFRNLYEMIAHDFVYANPQNLVIFPDNHDMSRIYTQLDEDLDLFKMAIAFIATFRGTPQYYYGTEILMKNPGTGDHGIIRSDFPGGWDGDAVNAFSGMGLTEQEKEAQNYFKKLLNWRKNKSAIHSGEFLHFVPNDGMYVYFRYNDQGEKVMVVLNKNEEDKIIDLSRFTEIISDAKGGMDVLTDKDYSFNEGRLSVPKKGTLILEVY